MNKKYSIGDYVIVSKIMFRDIKGSKVIWRKLPLIGNILGQVVGLCTRYDGHVEGGNTYFYDYSTYFVQEKTHLFWLVRFGLMNKDVQVREEDMRMATTEEVEEIPTRYPKPSMSEQDKKYLREDSKIWPRDKKGRWIKCTPTHL